jgi:hypothetical protein
MQVRIDGIEECRDNPMEDEDNLVISFVVGLTGVAKRLLNVLEVTVFPAKHQIH